jgi:hypothetical protein
MQRQHGAAPFYKPLRLGVARFRRRPLLPRSTIRNTPRLAAMRNANDRQEFMNQVNARMVCAQEPHANFVMLDPLRPVDQVLEHLRKHNIAAVAPRVPEMSNTFASLGTPAEMVQFWRTWDLMAPSKTAM